MYETFDGLEVRIEMTMVDKVVWGRFAASAENAKGDEKAIEALKKIPFEKCSNEFHFDSQILVQVRMAGLRVYERTIPTFYGNEKCYVPVIKYGFDVLRTMREYLLHRWGIKRYPYLEIEGGAADKAVASVAM